MSEQTFDELVRDGGAALRAGERDHARQLLSQAVRANPRSEQAWLLLAGAVRDPEQRRSCLERVLRLNPEHAIAQKALRTLIAPASPQPAAQPERPQPARLEPAPEPVQTRPLTPKLEPALESAQTRPLTPKPERPAAPVSIPAQVTPAQPASFDAILSQLRTPSAVAETTVAPPGLAAIAPPQAAVGTETTRLTPKPAAQFTLPMELAADDARRRREARQLWSGVLVAGIVLMLIGLALAAAVLLAG